MLRRRISGNALVPEPLELAEAHHPAFPRSRAPAQRCLPCPVPAGPSTSRERYAARRTGSEPPTANTAALPLPRNTNPRGAGRPVPRHAGPAPGRCGSCRCQAHRSASQPGPGHLWPQPTQTAASPSPGTAPQIRGHPALSVGWGSAEIRSSPCYFLTGFTIPVF